MFGGDWFSRINKFCVRLLTNGFEVCVCGIFFVIFAQMQIYLESSKNNINE